jgi:glutamate racemase
MAIMGVFESSDLADFSTVIDCMILECTHLLSLKEAFLDLMMKSGFIGMSALQFVIFVWI